VNAPAIPSKEGDPFQLHCICGLSFVGPLHHEAAEKFTAKWYAVHCGPGHGPSKTPVTVVDVDVLFQEYEQSLPAPPRRKHQFRSKVGWHQGRLIERCACGVERTALMTKVGPISRVNTSRFLYRRKGDTTWSETQIPCPLGGEPTP
jgi:hypothetical protein